MTRQDAYKDARARLKPYERVQAVTFHRRGVRLDVVSGGKKPKPRTIAVNYPKEDR